MNSNSITFISIWKLKSPPEHPIYWKIDNCWEVEQNDLLKTYAFIISRPSNVGRPTNDLYDNHNGAKYFLKLQLNFYKFYNFASQNLTTILFYNFASQNLTTIFFFISLFSFVQVVNLKLFCQFCKSGLWAWGHGDCLVLSPHQVLAATLFPISTRGWGADCAHHILMFSVLSLVIQIRLQFFWPNCDIEWWWNVLESHFFSRFPRLSLHQAAISALKVS